MTLIIHRCSCGHPDLFHRVDFASGAVEDCTGCLGGTHEFGPPEAIPSWRTDPAHPTAGTVADPNPVEPGTTLQGLPRLCGCQDCRDLYQRLSREVG
ncbi:hypothetical protein [Amycolatopsis minnesotensis]|uniref:Uncharacterized protein n=1 Tax=Amycolatopsis minnesotensis TaxID=337894 RepID=A0ABN2SH52_9PSEU